MAEQEASLKALGAAEVIGRLDPVEKPLGAQRWAGVVDSVGGSTLAAAAAQTMYRGAIASTGVAGGGAFESTVFPFILRGVRLLGVDSTLPWRLDGYPRRGGALGGVAEGALAHLGRPGILDQP